MLPALAPLSCLPVLFALALDLTPADPPARPVDPERHHERTSFQTGAAWAPTLQLRSDVAIVYGVDATLADRLAGWRAQGYVTHVMTGVSWGNYRDYLDGRFDGRRHDDEAQTDRRGRPILHGPGVPYMVPGEGFGKYLARGVLRAIDAGAEAVHLEEPEFWVRAGYSEGFQREWKAYYGEDWVAPHTSPDAQYRASLLKYHLDRRALGQVFDAVKAENARTGQNIKCYVPTHSLINYAHWRIVSPESSLTGVGADGFIAQVWTGTARTPNRYRGVRRERTFETAFLEYGAMMNVVRAAGGTVWFLNDPIEDNPDHTWADYRTNWESTLVASLLWPEVGRFEVMPWPERIFHGRYPSADPAPRGLPGRAARVPIPAAYATELLAVVTALNDMEQPEAAWECGTRGVGVVVSDSLMFQRGEPSPSDADIGSFYGLALPLVKHGLPAAPVQLETAGRPGALDPYRVLVLTYEGMKPLTPGVHDALATWVRRGGALVVVDDDRDPYHAVRSWWNDGKAGRAYATPRHHLFERLGLSAATAPGTHTVGLGLVVYEAASPAAWSRRADGADALRAPVRRACEGVNLAYREANHLVLRRGPYVVAAGLDESTDAPPRVLEGRFVDLFDAALPVVTSVRLTPGRRALLLDLDRARPKDGAAAVLASACRVRGARREADGTFRFHAEGPDGVDAVVRLALATAPTSVVIDGRSVPASDAAWDAASKTLLLRFANAARGREVAVR